MINKNIRAKQETDMFPNMKYTATTKKERIRTKQNLMRMGNR